MPTCYAKSTSGRMLTLECDSSDTVYDFKEKISDKTGIPVDSLRLVFRGQAMDSNSREIVSYGVEPESTVMFVVRGGGKRKSTRKHRKTTRKHRKTRRHH
jgi:hypothetical protein